jgi:Stress responsive A/B Barrel Domain
LIRHIVMWKLAATSPEEKALAAAEIKTALESLVPVVPQIIALEVHANSVSIESNWDLVLVADYATVADLDAYQVHPEHLKALPIVRSRVSERVAVDFEV